MTIQQPLGSAFYNRSAALVAPDLLGQALVVNTPNGFDGGWIVETEAYLQDDPASHSFRGRTERCRSMFGPPGTAYVYLIYGIHHCVNAVCQAVGIGEAVLIRALEAFQDSDKRNLIGPGRICSSLKIDRTMDGLDLCNGQSAIQILSNPALENFLKRWGAIQRSPRIGISKAREKPLRFSFKAQGPRDKNAW